MTVGLMPLKSALKRRRARAAADSAEAALREQGDSELRGKVQEVETGGLDLSLFGVVWVLIGTVFSTATQEICRLLPQCVPV